MIGGKAKMLGVIAKILGISMQMVCPSDIDFNLPCLSDRVNIVPT